MIHEKIASKDKQSVETIESIESESSNRPKREIRRESIIFATTDETENEFDAASISHYIQNLNQLKYWWKNNKISIVKTWMNMQDEHTSFFNQLNEKMKEMNELTVDYNEQANKLHDVVLIILELKIELREKNVKNSNTLLSTIEDDEVVSTFKKLSDSSIFTDDKDSIIDD